MLPWLIGGLVGFAVAMVLIVWSALRLARQADDRMSDAWRGQHRGD